MKSILTSFSFLFVCFSLSISTSSAQQPTKAINYQAVARSSAGNILASQNISIRITIEDVNNNSLYTETHSSTTNQFGLFTLGIGTGSVVSGNFNTLDWSAGDHYIKVEMDPTGGNSYVDMGTSMLLS